MYLGERDLNCRESRRVGYKPSCISERGIETVVYLEEREINSRVSRGEGYELSRIPERGI